MNQQKTGWNRNWIQIFELTCKKSYVSLISENGLNDLSSLTLILSTVSMECSQGHTTAQSADSKVSMDLHCGSPPGVIVADTLSFNAKIGLVDF